MKNAQGPKLKMPSLHTTFVLLATLVLFYPPDICRAASRCLDLADQQLFKVESWSGLRKWFERHVDCDDGYLAEGVSNYVVVSLAQHWRDLPRLERQLKKNPRFEAFVLKHIDATTDTGDLEAIVENATRRCPARSTPLCSSLISAARQALEEAEGTSLKD